MSVTIAIFCALKIIGLSLIIFGDAPILKLIGFFGICISILIQEMLLMEVVDKIKNK